MCALVVPEWQREEEYVIIVSEVEIERIFKLSPMLLLNFYRRFWEIFPDQRFFIIGYQFLCIILSSKLNLHIQNSHFTNYRFLRSGIIFFKN